MDGDNSSHFWEEREQRSELLCVSLHKMGFQNLLLLLRMMKVKYQVRILEEKNAASVGNILRNDQMQRRKASFQLLKETFSRSFPEKCNHPIAFQHSIQKCRNGENRMTLQSLSIRHYTDKWWC